MPLTDLIHAARDRARGRRGNGAHDSKLRGRLLDVFLRTYDLGFTAFGGPPVHFTILYRRFVETSNGRVPWIDEQTYQELFAISQALPGPASTKMLFCIAWIHAGFLPAVFVFLLWSLPGAIGMYGLSLGIQRVNAVLPDAVYALLSGLNASTVGIIALAAVQLAEKSIRDRLTRILVIFGACAGLCYNALWYFPVLILIGGIVTVAWDCWLRQQVGKVQAKRRRRRTNPNRESEEGAITANTRAAEPAVDSRSAEAIQRRPRSPPSNGLHESQPEHSAESTPEVFSEGEEVHPATDTLAHVIPIKLGLTIIALFFASFITLLTIRFQLADPPLPLQLFNNMYLAGTIIFGGGPVVIPLLRSYVVEPGWVSPRDFLIGLALIQAFPGPNFNFSVYLGALALASTGSSLPTVLGAFLAYVGIFAPGIALAVGAQAVWRVLRANPLVTSLLRGVNATAVGLVFTAVYRLWGIGYLTPEASAGTSLAAEPWWVVVAAVTYAESAWFGVPAAGAILVGGVLGVAWWGAVGR